MMRPINPARINKDGLAEPDAWHWQGLAAWRIRTRRTGIQYGVSPSAWAVDGGIVRRLPRNVLGIDLKCSEPPLRAPNHRALPVPPQSVNCAIWPSGAPASSAVARR